MICFFCKGPAHPATGHAYSETCLCCARCYRAFLPWYKARLRNPIALAAVVGIVLRDTWRMLDRTFERPS